MRDRFSFNKIIILLIILIPLLFAIRGGYINRLSAYTYLFLIQGYVAWFLFFKCGQPFFGYSVSMAIGAYVTIIFSTYLTESLLLSILIAAVIASIVSGIIFLATSRAKGFYISMASFLLAIMFPKLIEAMRELTGGRSGLYFSGLSNIVGRNGLYIIVITSTVIVAAIFFWLMGTKTGKIFTLISENDRLAKAIGINTFGYKILAYAIAGFISGFGGALYVNYTGFISSVDIEVFTTIYIFFIPLIGGSRVLYGPVIGAFFIILVPELMVSVERYTRIIFGLIFILVITLLPQGIGPTVQDLFLRIRKNRLNKKGKCEN